MVHLLHRLYGVDAPAYERNYGDPPENFDPLCPAFQGHSRSLDPTRIDRLPVTSY